MMQPLTPQRLAPVRDAISVVVRRLSALRASPEVLEMKARAEEYIRETEAWSSSPPAAKEREDLMKRLLKLHVDVAKLEGKAPAA